MQSAAGLIVTYYNRFGKVKNFSYIVYTIRNKDTSEAKVKGPALMELE